MKIDTRLMSLGVCMSVLIASISEPLGVAEQPLASKSPTATTNDSDPTPRFANDDMDKASTDHRPTGWGLPSRGLGGGRPTCGSEGYGRLAAISASAARRSGEAFAGSRRRHSNQSGYPAISRSSARLSLRR